MSISQKTCNFVKKKNIMSTHVSEASLALERLLHIMDELREKCPWDKKQTIESLRSNTIEETYELADAITKKDLNGIKKELGDLLLHVIFYAKIASEQNAFTITDVMEALSEKLIYRHPHIFADTVVSNAAEVSQNWEQLKLKEKGGNTRVLSGVPDALPSMIKAKRIQEKVRNVGFDWDVTEQVWDKVNEEMQEVREAIDAGDKENTQKEFGDLFFSLINAARLYHVDPETALEYTNQKFIRRFEYLESKTLALGISLKEMELAQMNQIWEEAKPFDK